MGYNIEFYQITLDGEKRINEAEYDGDIYCGSIPFAYYRDEQCKNYWQACIDFDGKQINDAIILMRNAAAKMIIDGIMPRMYVYNRKCSHAEDMLDFLLTISRLMSTFPQDWKIKLTC